MAAFGAGVLALLTIRTSQDGRLKHKVNPPVAAFGAGVLALLTIRTSQDGRLKGFATTMTPMITSGSCYSNGFWYGCSVDYCEGVLV